MNHRIIVVGGGITGLAAAHRLIELRRKNGFDLECLLLEAGPRLGGAIVTERVGGFLVEGGPDSFISEKPWALQLCERIGLTPRLISTDAARQNIYIVHKGRLELLPDGFSLMAPTRFWPVVRTPLFSWREKFRIASELFLPRGNVEGDESLASFVRRRFGREVLERVAQPLIGGIYAADPETLSLTATMPRFLEMERRKRSVILAMWEQRRRSRKSRSDSGARWSLFVTPAGGIQELVETIAGRLPAGTVRLDTMAVRLERPSGKIGWIIATNHGEILEADSVVLATPAYVSAELLASLEPQIARELSAIRYASTTTVSLAYRRSDVPHELASFGLIAPAVESRRIIACTFSSLKFAGRAPEGTVLLRAFVGGGLQPLLFEQDDRSMEMSVRQELAALLGIDSDPLFCRVYRHPRSMPQYRVGHLERVERIESQLEKLRGIALAGSAYRGVGIPDCVHSGEEAAERMASDLMESGS